MSKGPDVEMAKGPNCQKAKGLRVSREALPGCAG